MWRCVERTSPMGWVGPVRPYMKSQLIRPASFLQVIPMGSGTIKKLQAARKAQETAEKEAKSAAKKSAKKPHAKGANESRGRKKKNGTIPFNAPVFSEKEDLESQIAALQQKLSESEKNKPSSEFSGLVVPNPVVNEEHGEEKKDLTLDAIFASMRSKYARGASEAAPQQFTLQNGMLTLKTATTAVSPHCASMVGSLEEPRFTEEAEMLIRLGAQASSEDGGGYLLKSPFFRKKVIASANDRRDLIKALLLGWGNQVDSTKSHLFMVLVDLQRMIVTEHCIIEEVEECDTVEPAEKQKLREARFANAEVEWSRFGRHLFTGATPSGMSRHLIYQEKQAGDKARAGGEKKMDIPKTPEAHNKHDSLPMRGRPSDQSRFRGSPGYGSYQGWRGQARGQRGQARVGLQCYICGKEGHLQKDCSLHPARANKGCYTCGGFNHIAANCPSRDIRDINARGRGSQSGARQGVKRPRSETFEPTAMRGRAGRGNSRGYGRNHY
eukprot:gene20306-127_t